MLDELSPAALRAALEWQLELGCDEAIATHPLDRYALPERMPAPARPPTSEPASAIQGSAPTAPVGVPGSTGTTGPDPVTEAERMAGAAETLDDLKAALDAFPWCDLRLGAKSLVFSDGRPDARVMIIGEAPGREEDRAGLPFVGQAGQLLDRMLAAIGLARDADEAARGVYITNVLPWRPPSNRDPEPAEIAMMLPFLRRHVALVDPEILVCMGNHACGAVLNRRGITRLRGKWSEGFGLPVLPMLHPAYLLRQGAAKRDAWADLLALSARLAD
ncbi:uracil-DNA glycosylase family protein [Jannaschia sp. 2305UL9-9]|uniref:uracil-DNA glycosylase n=1 Tax=Jannaschia sp. 2305UL9-9 TaxID=3121638 RepID=UPI0035291F96